MIADTQQSKESILTVDFISFYFFFMNLYCTQGPFATVAPNSVRKGRMWNAFVLKQHQITTPTNPYVELVRKHNERSSDFAIANQGSPCWGLWTSSLLALGGQGFYSRTRPRTKPKTKPRTRITSRQDSDVCLATEKW